MDIFVLWSLFELRHFWQWLCGYLCVCVSGRQVSRFINLCSRNGIFLWRITYDVEHSLRANLKLRDFYDLKPYLRKTKTKIKIVSKKGFPFWCHSHPRLKWFFCLLLSCMCIGFYSLTYVWNIEIKGNDLVSSQEILEYLKENKVDAGLKKKEIDCSRIEVLLREKFHQIGWTTVYLNHTKLCIEVKESLYDVIDSSEYEADKGYHLVADKDARILSIVTRSGKAIVKEGSEIKTGDVLVLGQNEIFDDSGALEQLLYLKADAQIYGLVVREIVLPISEMEIVAWHMAGVERQKAVYAIGNHKLNSLVQKIEKNGAFLLNKEIWIEKDDEKICFRAKIYTREQIGINIPAEEVWDNEFE